MNKNTTYSLNVLNTDILQFFRKIKYFQFLTKIFDFDVIIQNNILVIVFSMNVKK